MLVLVLIVLSSKVIIIIMMMMMIIIIICSYFISLWRFLNLETEEFAQLFFTCCLLFSIDKQLLASALALAVAIVETLRYTTAGCYYGYFGREVRLCSTFIWQRLHQWQWLPSLVSILHLQELRFASQLLNSNQKTK